MGDKGILRTPNWAMNLIMPQAFHGKPDWLWFATGHGLWVQTVSPPRDAALYTCQDFDVDCYAQRRLSGGSHSYGGESPRLSPCSSMGKLSKSDEQLSSLDRDSGQGSRNTSCETLGESGAPGPSEGT